MHDLIRRTLEWVRLLFAPGTGKRRRPHRYSYPRLHLTVVRNPSAPLPRHRSPYGLPTPLDGTESALVRPYLAALEQEAALQQHCRLAPVLAADFGIDLDQRLIGAQKAAA
ncbi:hypothetical protein [Streptomyces sp. NPDC050287]|uniref:hypothetical protein n=1 Tax=Streptomyces sp. NPDC050287 TaxID=3365608 RepID=UPI0037A6DA45